MKTKPCLLVVSATMVFASAFLNKTSNASAVVVPSPVTQEERTAGDVLSAIEWRILAPENGKPFNDPFAKLTGAQLGDLSYVARIRRLIAEEKIDQDGIDAKAAAHLARKLTQEGVDIGYLLVQRQRVQQSRVLQVEDASTSIAETLGDKQVTLTGFVVPITRRQEKLTEFFLVPTVSTCSNEAAPSPLQVVFITTPQGIVHSDKRLAVRVTGTLQAKTTTKTVRNGIGMSSVQSSYAMPSPKIEFYSRTKRSSNLLKK